MPTYPPSALEQRVLPSCAGMTEAIHFIVTLCIFTMTCSSYHRPAIDIFLNIVFAGKCNTGIRTEPDLNPDEFIEGALHATSEVTKAMVAGDMVILSQN